MSIDNLRQYAMLDGEQLALLWAVIDRLQEENNRLQEKNNGQFCSMLDLANERDKYRSALADCVASLQGYRRETCDGQPCDAEKMAVALLKGPNVEHQGPRSGPLHGPVGPHTES